MAKSIGIDGGEEGRLFHHRMELQNGTGRLQVAVTHDGALLIDHGLGASALGVIAVVDGACFSGCSIGVVRTSRPSAPVGVVGSKVVAQLVGDYVQVPCEARYDGEVALVVHGAAESKPVSRAAHHAEVGNPTCSGVAALGHQVHHVPIGVGQDCIVGAPLKSELIEHGARVIDRSSPRFGDLPNIHVRGLQRHQVVQFSAVHLVDSCQHPQCPIDCTVAIGKGVVREVVDVQADFHTLGNHASLRIGLHSLQFSLLVFHGASEGVRACTFGNVKEDVVQFHALALFALSDWTDFPLSSCPLECRPQFITKKHHCSGHTLMRASRVANLGQFIGHKVGDVMLRSRS